METLRPSLPSPCIFLCVTLWHGLHRLVQCDKGVTGAAILALFPVKGEGPLLRRHVRAAVGRPEFVEGFGREWG